MKILVLCRPYLGDTVLTASVFRNLRAWMPQADITAAGYAGFTDALSLIPRIDEIVSLRKQRAAGESHAAFLRYWAGVLRRFRAARFDLVIDLMQTDKSALICAASAAPRRAGFVNRRRRARHRVYTDLALWTEAELQTTHHVDLYLKTLEILAIPIRSRFTEIVLQPEEIEAARERLRHALPDRTGPVVAVHPGASTPNRCWPPEHFAAACDWLQRHLGARVLLLGGAKEAQALAIIRSAMRTKAAALEGPLSTREFAAVLAAADLLFGNGSGPMHLAAAVGTPVVAIFDGAVASQWLPLGENHRVVLPEKPCPCVSPDLCMPPNPYHTFCIRTVSRERVFAALAQQLTERAEMPLARRAR
ncbi:MAG: glycosyltransferase family 9 protein [Gemmatimonadetes bacterium]|jgi:lipopolysaccharide heptosyltransferase II|nr:glycosyltransferase family 9 protein [Gemmatimonadota bacterium]